MEFIQLNNEIMIKKMDPNNQRDVWLVNELDKDELISGENGYLWPISNIFSDVRYLFRNDLYGSPYAIYYEENPVGYIEFSNIIFCNEIHFVNIVYALLQHERGKGIATKTLYEVTKKILTDPESNVEKVSLLFDLSNNESISVAKRAGFVADNSIHFDDMVGYQKTKRMI